MSEQLLAGYISKRNKAGYAVGRSYILDDTVDFVFEGEKFSISSRDIADRVKSDGTFLLMKIGKLRRILKEKKDG